jgi:hypothetical protein
MPSCTSIIANLLHSMPLETNNPRQSRINWTVNSAPTRQTPSRSTRTVIHNYSQLERSEFTPRNPSKATNLPASSIQTQEDGDIKIADGEEDLATEASPLSSVGGDPNTPTRRNLLSTIIIKRRHLGNKPRKL